MGNRAIDPKDLARVIHAWDAAFERRREARRVDAEQDVARALKLLRQAERVLRKCVYEKRTLVRERVVPFACVDCTGELEWEEFNAAFVEKRVQEPRCRLHARLHAHASAQDEDPPAAPAPPAPPQEEQGTQEAPDPTDGVS